MKIKNVEKRGTEYMKLKITNYIRNNIDINVVQNLGSSQILWGHHWLKGLARKGVKKERN